MENTMTAIPSPVPVNEQIRKVAPTPSVKAVPQGGFPVPAAAAPPRPKPQVSVSELVDKVSAKLAKELGPKFDRLEESFRRLSDDLYNAALLQNPAAFTLMHGRAGKVSITNASPVLVHDNTENESVVVYARAVNAAGDVQSLYFANTIGVGADLEALTEAPDAGGRAGGVIMRPGSRLYANVRATTAPSVATPVYIIFTVIRLRGCAGVFGG